MFTQWCVTFTFRTLIVGLDHRHASESKVMIHLTTGTQILLTSDPADFRMGIYWLAARCRGKLAAEARLGALFVFINRSKTMIRTLAFDGTGFWLMTPPYQREIFMSGGCQRGASSCGRVTLTAAFCGRPSRSPMAKKRAILISSNRSTLSHDICWDEFILTAQLVYTLLVDTREQSVYRHR